MKAPQLAVMQGHAVDVVGAFDALIERTTADGGRFEIVHVSTTVGPGTLITALVFYRTRPPPRAS